jgi:transposase-like protein
MMEKSNRGKRRKFSDEYKSEAVRLVGDSGKSIGDSAEARRAFAVGARS